MTQDNEPLARRIFGARAAFYTTSPAHTNAQELERLVAVAQPSPDWLALDIATGTGHTAFAIAPHVQQVTATDITPEMLAEGRKLQAERNVTNITFQIADVHHLPFDAGSYQLVTSRRAPHHFTNIRLAISEMARVLSAGGRLVIDDRSIPEDDFVDERMNLLDTLHDHSHVRQYRPSEWADMLTTAGLAVEHVFPYHRQRPLSSLTQHASADDIAQMESIVSALNDDQRRAMNVEYRDGEWHLNHWFVLVSAVKEIQ
jgi:SAM-dependent methyltransferase